MVIHLWCRGDWAHTLKCILTWSEDITKYHPSFFVHASQYHPIHGWYMSKVWRHIHPSIVGVVIECTHLHVYLEWRWHNIHHPSIFTPYINTSSTKSHSKLIIKKTSIKHNSSMVLLCLLSAHTYMHIYIYDDVTLYHPPFLHFHQSSTIYHPTLNDKWNKKMVEPRGSTFLMKDYNCSCPLDP